MMEGYFWLKLESPMKNLLLPFLLCISATLFAQNWMPVVPGDVYHFRALDSSYVTHTIRIDSIKVNGTDSIFYLNRIVFVDNVNLNLITVSSGAGQFLGQTMTKKPNGRCTFFSQLYNTGAITLFPLTEPGSSWTASSTPLLTASVVSKEASIVLGEPDSIKTIQFSNGVQWVFSKNHGIVDARDLFFTTERLQLVGIETRNLGEKALGFDGLFDFQPGDVFEWHLQQSMFGSGLIRFSKWYILQKEVLQDEFRYLVDRRVKTIYTSPPFGLNYKHDTAWIDFKKSVYPNADAYNRQQVTLGSYFSDETSYCNAFASGKKIGSKVTAPGEQLECAVFPGSNDFQESYIPLPDPSGGCCYQTGTNCEWRRYFEDYRSGLGRVELDIRVINNSFHETLTGALIQGDTVWGTLTSDAFFTATHAPASTFPLAVVPNPAQDFVRIQAANLEGEIWVRIHDISGKTYVSRNQNLSISQELDISALPSGLYLVQLTDNHRTWVGKFQKM